MTASAQGTKEEKNTKKREEGRGGCCSGAMRGLLRIVVHAPVIYHFAWENICFFEL